MKNGVFVCMTVSAAVCLYLRFPLKDDHSAPFVPCGQELSGVVELNSGDDISWGGHRDEDGERGGGDTIPIS